MMFCGMRLSLSGLNVDSGRRRVKPPPKMQSGATGRTRRTLQIPVGGAACYMAA
jgi:hypothetical protein